MIDQTIAQIEERIRKAASIPEERRTELLELVATLKTEVQQVSRTNSEAARSIAGHTERSTAAATQPQPDPERLQESLDDLSTSVASFEESHPKLVAVVNRICMTLSNLGI